jgi:hypothetical protein
MRSLLGLHLHCLLLLGLFVCASCNKKAPVSPNSAESATQEILQLTQRRFDANHANDRAFYERLLASNFRDIWPNGFETKQEYLDREFPPQSAGHRGERAQVSDFHAAVDRDTAVATYLVVEPTPLGTQRFEARWNHIDTYTRVDGAWKLLSMTFIPPPSWPEVAKVDPKLYSEYAGSYEWGSGEFNILTVEAGHLMSESTGQPKVELFPENATTFFDKTDYPDARYVFQRDVSGKVTGFVYRAQNQSFSPKKTK